MARQKRIKGGIKNSKTGQKWTREELAEVVNLYLNDRKLKIHESNISIQQLAVKLDRTIRSVEAQLLMFRNLDRLGFYGYKNMNTLSKVLWKEYINNNIN